MLNSLVIAPVPTTPRSSKKKKNNKSKHTFTFITILSFPTYIHKKKGKITLKFCSSIFLKVYSSVIAIRVRDKSLALDAQTSTPSASSLSCRKFCGRNGGLFACARLLGVFTNPDTNQKIPTDRQKWDKNIFYKNSHVFKSLWGAILHMMTLCTSPCNHFVTKNWKQKKRAANFSRRFVPG